MEYRVRYEAVRHGFTVQVLRESDKGLDSMPAYEIYGQTIAVNEKQVIRRSCELLRAAMEAES